MKSVLDQYIPTITAFRPGTTRELFSLRLAQKLHDVVAVRHYRDLTDSYSEGQLLLAYRRTLRTHGQDYGRRFQGELQQIHANGQHNHITKLISIRIERRTVAIAIFHGEHLEYADSRQLSSDREKAVASAVAFVNWILGRFDVESTAVEAILNGHEIQRRALHEGICATLRERVLPIWEVPKPVLLEGFGHPPVKSRAELRRIATTIWPILAGTNSKTFVQDAAILGLHVQIERLFIT